jgi:hypothetical protein
MKYVDNSKVDRVLAAHAPEPHQVDDRAAQRDLVPSNFDF